MRFFGNTKLADGYYKTMSELYRKTCADITAKKASEKDFLLKIKLEEILFDTDSYKRMCKEATKEVSNESNLRMFKKIDF